MKTIIRWTEDELIREITGLDALIREAQHPEHVGGRRAKSYLKALLRDHKETLRLLQYRKVNGLDRSGAPVAARAWH